MLATPLTVCIPLPRAAPQPSSLAWPLLALSHWRAFSDVQLSSTAHLSMQWMLKPGCRCGDDVNMSSLQGHCSFCQLILHRSAAVEALLLSSRPVLSSPQGVQELLVSTRHCVKQQRCSCSLQRLGGHAQQEGALQGGQPQLYACRHCLSISEVSSPLGQVGRQTSQKARWMFHFCAFQAPTSKLSSLDTILPSASSCQQ